MTVTQTLTALTASLLLVLGPASLALPQPREPISYERFLEETEPQTEETTTPRAPTWTVEPGPEGTIRPTEPVRPGREAPDDPELQQRLLEQQARSADTEDGASDIAGYLRSDQAGPPPVPLSTRQRVLSVLSAVLVALVGALAGIGIILLRARYGKPSDSSRRTKRAK